MANSCPCFNLCFRPSTVILQPPQESGHPQGFVITVFPLYTSGRGLQVSAIMHLQPSSASLPSGQSAAHALSTTSHMRNVDQTPLQ